MKALTPWIQLLLQRRKRLLVGVLLMALTAIAGIALLALSGWFITASALTGLLLAAGVSVHLDVYIPGSGIRAFALTRTLARYGERLYNHDTVLRLLADIRIKLFSTLGASNPGDLKATHSAVWLSRLTRDVDALDSLYLRLLAPPFVAAVATVLVLGAMALVLPLTATILAVGFLSLAALSTILPAWLGRQSGRDMVILEADVRQQSIDYLSGLPELQAARQAHARADALMQSQDRYQHQQRRQIATVSMTESLQSAMLGVLALLTLFSGLQAWQQDLVSGPVVTLWTLAIVALGEAYTSLPKAFSELGKTCRAASQLNSLDQLSQRSFSVDSGEPFSLNSLSLQQLQPAYPGHPELSPVTVELSHGQTLVVTGNSGSGKSSLASLLAADRSPVSGDIRVNAAALSAANGASWRQAISWLTQETVLFSATVRDNLRLANPLASDPELWAVLAQVDLDSRFETAPGGLSTWIGQTGLALSGGEQRRLVLARALLRPAQLYLLDEPFRGVDARTARLILSNIEQQLARKTVVWLAHEHSVLPVADQHIHLAGIAHSG